MAFSYPVSLELRGRRCVVVGGGGVAETKARALLDAGAEVRVIAEDFTGGLHHLEECGSIELVRRPYATGDLAGAFLAIGASGDPATNEQLWAEAESRGILLNAVDDIAHCHFSAPSVLRRGDLSVAISTGGKAPALAKRLRAQLARYVGEEYGALVEALGDVRAEMLPSRDVEFETWAQRWQAALDAPLAERVRHGGAAGVKEHLRRCLAGSAEAPRPGRVAIVGAGPGDPGLITVRGMQLLDEADVVVYDRLVHPSLVEGKEAIFVGKRAARHYVSQDETFGLLVLLARGGKAVVRLKGGDPFVFGRGAEEAEALAASGIDFEVVPAPTSAIAALAYAGIPVTDRRCASSVAFATGHCSADGTVDWRGLATAADTIVALMVNGHLDDVVSELMAGGRPSDDPAAIIENGTLPGQRVAGAPLAEIPATAARTGIGSPMLLVVGDVVRLRERIGWFRPEPTEPAPDASAAVVPSRRSA
jgi:uroporphyrin-III C-methyltransferase/precorrin-2 dehydrogenase/sirohydrochlorin ferrochelatase